MPDGRVNWVILWIALWKSETQICVACLYPDQL